MVRCIASYTAAFTNPENITSPAARTLPQMVTNDSRDSVPIIVDGYQNDLFSLWDDSGLNPPPKPQAKAVTLTFTGTSPRLYEIMILDRLLTLKSDGGFSRIEFDSLDLGSVEPDLRGRLSYVPTISGERDKWLIRYSLLSLRTDERDKLADQLLAFMRKHKNFAFAAEYNRYPDRIFPAVWGDQVAQIRYLSRWKGSGRKFKFYSQRNLTGFF